MLFSRLNGLLSSKRLGRVHSSSSIEMAPETGFDLNTLQKENEDLQNRLSESEEKYLKLSEEFRSFSYIISHDLKAPLRAIGSLTEWLAEDYVDRFDELGKKRLDLLVNRTARLKNLIEGVLQYSRVGRDQTPHDFVALSELLSKVDGGLKKISKGHSFKVEGNVSPVFCNRKLMERAFEALIKNALEHSGKEDVAITVRCSEDSQRWYFEVEDDGEGIDPKQFSRVFEMFQTLQRKDDHETTGVGLTLTKKIINMHKGDIHIESELGKGCSFKFSLSKEGCPALRQEKAA